MNSATICQSLAQLGESGTNLGRLPAPGAAVRQLLGAIAEVAGAECSEKCGAQRFHKPILAPPRRPMQAAPICVRCRARTRSKRKKPCLARGLARASVQPLHIARHPRRAPPLKPAPLVRPAASRRPGDASRRACCEVCLPPPPAEGTYRASINLARARHRSGSGAHLPLGTSAVAQPQCLGRPSLSPARSVMGL